MALNHLPEFRVVIVLKFVFIKWRHCKVVVASER